MKAQKKSPLVVIFLTVFIYLVGFGIMIPIMPVLSRDFGATPQQVGLLMAVYSLMQFIFAPLWGRLSDRLGRRPIIMFCLLGEAASYLLFAFARNLELLFVARIFAGFFGASISTASAYISDVTSKEERSKGMALIGAAFGLGFIFGPAIGGGLTWLGGFISSEPHFSTSFAALFVSGLCVFNFIFSYRTLKESLPLETRQLNQTASTKKESRLDLFLKYYRRPVLGPLIILFFTATTAMALMESTLVLLVSDRFGWGIREASFGFAFIGIIATMNQGFFVRKLLPKWGERRMLVIGLVMFAMGMLGIAFSGVIAALCISMTLLSFGHSFTNPSLMGSLSLMAKSDEQGAALGTSQSAASLGRIVGPALGGFLYGQVAMDAPYLFAGVLVILCLVAVLKMFAQLPDSARAHAS